MRLIGERRAGAAAVLAFFTLLYLFVAMSPLVPSAAKPMFMALASAYLLAFFGVVAGWFWARWYTMGLAYSGIVMAAIAIFKEGFMAPLVFFGATHAFIALALMGPGSSAFYEGRSEWRARWSLDDNGVNRLGKAITRAGASLPYLIMASLAPRQGMGLVLGGLAFLCAAFGLHALVRMRTWGIFSLAGAAALALGSVELGAASLEAPLPVVPMTVLAVAGMIAAVLPFAGPLVDFLRAGSKRGG